MPKARVAEGKDAVARPSTSKRERRPVSGSADTALTGRLDRDEAPVRSVDRAGGENGIATRTLRLAYFAFSIIRLEMIVFGRGVIACDRANRATGSVWDCRTLIFDCDGMRSDGRLGVIHRNRRRDGRSGYRRQVAGNLTETQRHHIYSN